MKHVYTFSRTLVLATVLLLAGHLKAQIQGVTTVTTTGNCATVVANFNSNDQGFNSPSIYYGNSPFYFNTAQGWWSEVDGVSAVPPIPGGGGARLVSIISPLYPNPSGPGIFDVGFYYIVPNPAVNRFQVRIISATPQGAFTVYNVEATTGFRTFAAYSTTPTPYTGTAPQIAGMQGNICVRLLDEDITNAPGVAYRVEVTYEVAEPQFTVFDDLSIGGTIVPAPLPVNFLGVTPNKVEGGVNVKWDVADEINVKQYELERSVDGRSFTSVGVVNAKGDRVYNLIDGNPKIGTAYYRVKSQDVDGKVKLSGIIKFTNGAANASGSIRVYPTPARDQITVQHKQLGSGAKITITTADGRVVKGFAPPSGSANSMIDISSLTAGMYILRLDTGNGKVESTTFIKQ